MRTAVTMRRVATAPRGRGNRRQPRCASAAPRPCAVVDTFEKADVGVGPLQGAVGADSSLRGVVGLLLVLCEAELGLDGGAVDAECMETLAGALGQLHVLLAAVRVDGEGNLEVHARYDLGVGQLPDVDVVAADDAGERLDVLPNLRYADVFWRRLEEHLGSGARERDAGVEDDGGDEERDGGVGVVLAGQIGQPDDECGYDDADVAQCIAYDMEDHGIHAHVAVAVTMTTTFAMFLGQGVIVTDMDAGISTWACPRA